MQKSLYNSEWPQATLENMFQRGRDWDPSLGPTDIGRHEVLVVKARDLSRSVPLDGSETNVEYSLQPWREAEVMRNMPPRAKVYLVRVCPLPKGYYY